MSTNTQFQLDAINKKLVNATIVGAAVDQHDEFFGLVVEGPDMPRQIVWVQCDAEGNAPGWLAIEKAPQ